MTSSDIIRANRAPVLTLWASIVAERLSYPAAAALTLGRAVAGYNAQAESRRLGLVEEREAAEADIPSCTAQPLLQAAPLRARMR